MSDETDRWEWLRQQLMLRCGGRCEWSGEQIGMRPWSVHHRRPRGMGGSRHVETLADLVVVTGDGVRGSHGWIEAHRDEAVERGYLVPHGVAEPADVPLTLFSGRRVLLYADAPFYRDTGTWATKIVSHATLTR